MRLVLFLGLEVGESEGGADVDFAWPQRISGTSPQLVSKFMAISIAHPMTAFIKYTGAGQSINASEKTRVVGLYPTEERKLRLHYFLQSGDDPAALDFSIALG
ncbi:hypothetical protein P175DRAFT_0532155 [Aspergillus ochraceoroseus IBT 24754]|uniref:Uncharacterized protein n=1 Tax=Aspergillus ochraceoroseus IBT 24754 TaxID=1392256 RepID=A0A2T5LWY6_9EURO|nr:uncharacterized protein P175DRAFT_0532155 [Aspergillus ochraceoroseus IBT 24754]PTU20802.1 hypothetical protein P175DRAFT_0532155 [Aspergillus ochraceoroseus IBT 24754]